MKTRVVFSTNARFCSRFALRNASWRAKKRIVPSDRVGDYSLRFHWQLDVDRAFLLA